MTLLEELKAATLAVHTRVEAAPFFADLGKGKLPLESYVGELRAFATFHAVVERAVTNSDEARMAAVWREDMRKMSLLERDLRVFEPRAVADLRNATEAALDAADQLTLWAAEQPLALLGVLYVLEGSTLGAKVVRPLVARAFHLNDDGGLSYLGCYGNAVADHWRGFQERMNALELTAGERAKIVGAADEFFVRIELVFRALYPFAPESKAFLVTYINPEAGRHEVPADPREIQAATRGGDICWERWPYLAMRYGERGRRFSRSDAAWKAALCHYAPAQIVEQIHWLGRVLSSRGMPTLLLHDQLGLLVAELTAAVPEKAADFAKLQIAADALHEARRAQLTNNEMATLGTEFDRAAGAEWIERLPHTGQLLACAVADEANGSRLAVESLRLWLSDEERFPPAWISAVQSTLGRAREAATRKAVPSA